MKHNHKLYCDITELYAGSLGRGGFYGIARVVAELALELDSLVPDTQYVVFSASLNRFFCVKLQREQLLSGRPASFGFNVDRLVFAFDQRCNYWLESLPSSLVVWLKARLLWITTQLKRGAVKQLTPGIVFSAARPKFISRYSRALQKQRLELASLVHDFFPLLDNYDRPGQAFVDAFLIDNRLVMESSAVVIANSYFTRDCLLQLQQAGRLPLPSRLAVAQLAHECRCPAFLVAHATAAPNSCGWEQDDSPFLLAVGCRPGRKNLQCVLEALLLVQQWNWAPETAPAMPRLVLAGALRGSVRRFIDQSRFASIRSAIQLVASPSQAELIHLYQEARATVLPSFSEGWGLPASESLWVGTPVLVSDTPVMREVCGNLGIYFSPERPEELAQQINRLGRDSMFYQSLQESIAEAKPTLRRWVDTANDICRAL
jgi:glycosyltransferase involved in cell wall biosynthesis